MSLPYSTERLRKSWLPEACISFPPWEGTAIIAFDQLGHHHFAHWSPRTHFWTFTSQRKHFISVFPHSCCPSIKNIWRCVKSCSALKSPSCTAASVAQANLIIFMYIWWFTFVLLLLPSVDTCWVQFLVHCYMCSAKPLQIVPLEILSKSI